MKGAKFRYPRRPGETGDCRLAGVLPQGKPPSEFRIFTPGVNQTDYGPFTFDGVSAAMVMQAYADENKGPLKFDYNHGMAVDHPTAEQGKSAGTWVPAIRDGELWATDCQWTEEASAYLESREYENFSPWFFWDWPVGADVPRVTKVCNCALVNIAGLYNMRSIAAAARTGDDMNAEEQIAKLTAEVARLVARNDALEGELRSTNARSGSAQLAAALGVPVNADQAVLLAGAGALATFRASALQLAGASEPAAALGTFTGWKAKADRTDALMAAEEAREAAAVKAEFDGVIATAVTETRLETTEDGPRRLDIVGQALKLGAGKPSREGVAFLRGVLPHIAPLVKQSGAKPPTDGEGAPAQGENLRRTAQLAGVKPETVDKVLKQNQERDAQRAGLRK